MIDENVIKVLDSLKSESVFEESKNGNKGHVIWSNKFYKLSQSIVKLLHKHIVTNRRELLIGLIKEGNRNLFCDKPRTPEKIVDDFLANL